MRLICLFLLILVAGCKTVGEKSVTQGMNRYFKERGYSYRPKIHIIERGETYWTVEWGAESHALTAHVDPRTGEVVKVFPGF